jgi:hypothetical protein
MTPRDDEARARAFIAQVEQRFTAAKTVPDHPHQYIARSWLSAEQQADFDWLVEVIMRIGYRGSYWGSSWRYVDLDDHKYWPSRSWYGADAGTPNAMLNRARLDQGQLSFAVEIQEREDR